MSRDLYSQLGRAAIGVGTLKLRLIIAVIALVMILGLLFSLGFSSVLGGSIGFAGSKSCADPSIGGAGGIGRIGWPLKPGSYRISSPYGPRGATGASAAEFHHGVDLAAPLNTPIYAVADGVIVRSGTASGFGDWIVEDSTVGGAKVSFVYGHEFPSGLLAQEGQTVKAGDLIGLVGENGEATGPHVHFEVWPGGRLTGGHDVDPLPWLTGNTPSGPPSAAPTTTPAPVTNSSGGLNPGPATPTGPQTLGPAPTTSAAPPTAAVVLNGPTAPQGQQATSSIGVDQRANVDTIVGVVKGRGLPMRAAVIAVASALQESGLRNISYGDRDSLGLFQERPSQGWGTAAQILDPVYATGKWLDALVQVPSWASLPLADAAQAVERSGNPTAYAKWEVQSETLVAASLGVDPIVAGVGNACTLT